MHHPENDSSDGSQISNEHGGRLVLILRFSASLCLAGWAWVHLYWEGPLGVLLWSDNTLEWAKQLGYSWNEFVGTGANDGLIQRLQRGIGWTLLLAAAGAVLVRSPGKTAWAMGIIGSLLLFLIGDAKYLASQQQLPMLIEHGGQMLSPILFVLALSYGPRHRVTVIVAVAAVVLTFAGHGCYAIGLWPTPSTFFAMTAVILGTDYDASVLFLRIAGGLDFGVCVALLVPPFRRGGAAYATAWGFFTAIARPAAGMSIGLNYFGADQYLHEAILRTPHFLIPLYLFYVWRPSSDVQPTLH
ncbi:MAG: hypothetical protein AAF670_18225 [Planctomycetota bacterium]